MSMCRSISWVVEKVYLLWPVCSLDQTLSLSPASFCSPRPVINLLVILGTSWLPTFAFQSPLMKMTFFCVCVHSRRCCRSSQNVQLLSHQCWSTDVDYCDVEWFALETNCDHSVIFETALKYCILDSFVDYEGYSIFSKEFLPTVVDIMVIRIKFTHSRAFQFTAS